MYLFSNISQLSSQNLWDKILNWYNNSVFRELSDYLSDKLFSVEFGDYDYITVTGSGQNLRNVIIGLTFGIIFAAAFMYYQKAVKGRFVRRLLKEEAFTGQTALTLRQTGVFRNPSIRKELIRGGALTKIVEKVPEEDGKENVDFLTAKYYIPEEKKYLAEARYDINGNRAPQLILTVIFAIVISYLICRFLPTLVGFADWLISIFAPK